MSKKRLEGGLDEAINMDVMMDNMTDVVGTLLMVLIIVQLKVNISINNIQSNLPKVTEQQVEEMHQQAADIEQSAATAQEELNRRQETTLDPNTVQLLAVEELRKQLDARQQEITSAKDEMTALIDEREKLKGLLDTTPVPVIPDAKIVRMPAAREIPEGAQLIRVLVAGGRVYLADTAKFKELALKAFYRGQNSLILTRGVPDPNKDTNIYDHEKTVAFLTRRDLSDDEFTIEFPIMKHQNRIQMHVKPQPEAGETPEEFTEADSEFVAFLRRVKREPQAVVWFLVHPDSFETYLQARETCEEVQVAAGWELHGIPFLAENLYEFETNVMVPPPPPPPPDPGAISIPAPKQTID
jgi:hypothetical protein